MLFIMLLVKCFFEMISISDSISSDLESEGPFVDLDTDYGDN